VLGTSSDHRTTRRNEKNIAPFTVVGRKQHRVLLRNSKSRIGIRAHGYAGNREDLIPAPENDLA
jgi:hypothetical protein